MLGEHASESESTLYNAFHSVILVTLYADSLSIVVPAFSPNTYKLMGIAVSVYLSYPLGLTSLTSVE